MAAKPLPSPEVLRQLLSYDPETGKLFWKHRGPEWFEDKRFTKAGAAKVWNAKYAGKQAFTPTNSKGYHTGSVLGKMLLAHRVGWAIHYGRWPAFFLDHADSDRTNNALSNLREANRSENGCNRTVARNSRSGVKGVRWYPKMGKWQARITVHGIQTHLGYFWSIEAAADAYSHAASRLHGEFARSS